MMPQKMNDSDTDSDKYSSDPQIEVKTDNSPNNLDDQDDQDDYEDSPRVKSDSDRRKGQSDLNDNGEDQEQYPPDESLEVDEDEMIDVAEKIFVKIAEEIFKQKVTVRMVLQQHIFPAEIDGDQYELLAPEGLIEGIRDLGIDDLTNIEIQCLLKVLSKPELDGAILMQEFLQIMENFGLYDDGPDPNQSMTES